MDILKYYDRFCRFCGARVKGSVFTTADAMTEPCMCGRTLAVDLYDEKPQYDTEEASHDNDTA